MLQLLVDGICSRYAVAHVFLVDDHLELGEGSVYTRDWIYDSRLEILT
jgi:hypothetical protein